MLATWFNGGVAEKEIGFKKMNTKKDSSIRLEQVAVVDSVFSCCLLLQVLVVNCRF